MRRQRGAIGSQPFFFGPAQFIYWYARGEPHNATTHSYFTERFENPHIRRTNRCNAQPTIEPRLIQTRLALGATTVLYVFDGNPDEPQRLLKAEPHQETSEEKSDQQPLYRARSSFNSGNYKFWSLEITTPVLSPDLRDNLGDNPGMKNLIRSCVPSISRASYRPYRCLNVHHVG